jgi:hypothetical protein
MWQTATRDVGALGWPPFELEIRKPGLSALLVTVAQSNQECDFLIMKAFYVKSADL